MKGLHFGISVPVDTCSLNPCTSSSNQYWECINLAPGHRKCICEEGFTGNKCDTSLDECDTMTCFNGGTCSEAGANGTECICNRDFNGTNCERRFIYTLTRLVKRKNISDYTRCGSITSPNPCMFFPLKMISMQKLFRSVYTCAL